MDDKLLVHLIIQINLLLIFLIVKYFGLPYVEAVPCRSDMPVKYLPEIRRTEILGDKQISNNAFRKPTRSFNLDSYQKFLKNSLSSLVLSSNRDKLSKNDIDYMKYFYQFIAPKRKIEKKEIVISEKPRNMRFQKDKSQHMDNFEEDLRYAISHGGGF